MPKQYRLLAGSHVEEGRMYEAGQVLVSDHDLIGMFNKPGLQPRFELLGGRVEHGVEPWDPRHETIDEFAARMKARQAQPRQQLAAKVWDPRTESLAEFTGRMQAETGQPTVPGAAAAEPLAPEGHTFVRQVKSAPLSDLLKHAAEEEIALSNPEDRDAVERDILNHYGVSVDAENFVSVGARRPG